MRELAPREPPVYILLGNICQRLGRPTQALGYFNTALSLDPKEGSALRESLENLDPEVDMESNTDERSVERGTGGGGEREEEGSPQSMMSAQSEAYSSDMDADDFGASMLSPDNSV